MSEAKPVLHLLAGLPGSGKTTYALLLERRGVTRVSVDEEILERHGQIGVDYSVEEHVELLAPVVAWARRQIADALISGTSVVLDHGLGTRNERDEFKVFAGEHGAAWELTHFNVDLCGAARPPRSSTPIGWTRVDEDHA